VTSLYMKVELKIIFSRGSYSGAALVSGSYTEEEAGVMTEAEERRERNRRWRQRREQQERESSCQGEQEESSGSTLSSQGARFQVNRANIFT
jgi:hypothetical protein